MSPDTGLHRNRDRLLKRVIASPSASTAKRVANLETMNRLLLLAKVLAK